MDVLRIDIHFLSVGTSADLHIRFLPSFVVGGRRQLQKFLPRKFEVRSDVGLGIIGLASGSGLEIPLGLRSGLGLGLWLVLGFK